MVKPPSSGVEQLDLRLVRYFAVLMEEQNVSRAAERLDISQSALSHALARLRVALGDPLVVRSGTSMVATRRALELAPIASAILRDLDRMLPSFEVFDPPTARTRFVMSSTWYLDDLLMPLLVARLQRDAPGVSLETWPPNSQRGDDWIANGEIDFRLGWVPEPAPELRFQGLYVDRCVVVARQGHPLLEQRLTLEQFLAAGHLRLAPARRVNQLVQQALMALNIPELQPAFVAHSHHAALGTIAKSDLIAILPARIVDANAMRLGLQKRDPPFTLPEMPVAVYWHERTHMLDSHRWFRRLLASVARQFDN